MMASLSLSLHADGCVGAFTPLWDFRVQKLFGYGCLDGKISFAEDPSRSLVQEFVRVVADCQSCHEDSIHLQIIKVGGEEDAAVAHGCGCAHILDHEL